MSHQVKLATLAQTLYEIDAIRFGHFQLHSGRTSRIYLDLRLLSSHPDALRLVAAAYRPILESLTFDLLVATPLAALPIGTAICMDMEVPLIYPRKQIKGYGTGKAIEGTWREGQKAVVIDDLVTSGDSILQTIETLKAAGLTVTDAVVLIDREQGGVAALRERGYTLQPVAKISRLLAELVDLGHITAALRSEILDSLA
jgi:orotate phosphoribosyltransferase